MNTFCTNICSNRKSSLFLNYILEWQMLPLLQSSDVIVQPLPKCKGFFLINNTLIFLIKILFKKNHKTLRSSINYIYMYIVCKYADCLITFSESFDQFCKNSKLKTTRDRILQKFKVRTQEQVDEKSNIYSNSYDLKGK